MREGSRKEKAEGKNGASSRVVKSHYLKYILLQNGDEGQWKLLYNYVFIDYAIPLLSPSNVCAHIVLSSFPSRPASYCRWV